MNTIIWILLAILSCVGFVQTVSWIFVHYGRRKTKVYRVFPVGGPQAERQFSFIHTCYQWESNPAGNIYVIYDCGLEEDHQRQAVDLARDMNSKFVGSPQQLQQLIDG